MKKEVIILKTLKEAGFNMDKIKIYYNSVGALCIRDYTFTFYNGLATLNHINYYDKTFTLDIIKPNYLIHSQLTYNFK